ncbi:hypothetical protein [Streptomyces olindensis]|uniref:hypothetical protein n=1 Tax=Streptomyces olindensis TaxID=358823 RepID=UPI00365BB5EA
MALAWLMRMVYVPKQPHPPPGRSRSSSLSGMRVSALRKEEYDPVTGELLGGG